MTVATLPTLNSTLLFDLVRWAEHDAEFDHQIWGTWDQGAWGWVMADQIEKAYVRNGVCRTAYCMAGQAVHQAGYRLLFDANSQTEREIEMADGRDFVGQVATANDCIKQYDTGRKDSKGFQIWEDVATAEPEPINQVAIDILGLTHEEADVFFEGSNEAYQLREMANWFCQSRGLPLLYPYDDVYEPFLDEEDVDF
jgi:hypothetical protein